MTAGSRAVNAATGAGAGTSATVRAVRRVVICGATGSIGTQALDVCDADADLSIVGLSAHSRVAEVLAAAQRRGVDAVALTGPPPGLIRDGQRVEGVRVYAGPDAAARLVRDAGADVVLNGVVGAAGLSVSVAALESGADLALANKETLLVAGPLVTALARERGRVILPVDSEHSALSQCLEGRDPATVEALVLTASGGPFRGRSRASLLDVTVDEALAHPTWSMGAKISVDSATLMNKGLEVIEAALLFGVGPDRIEVVVHPQSLVHSLVRFRDGALLAHLGLPDMRVPISYALTYPRRGALDESLAPRLDLATAGRLDFEAPDTDAFPALALAFAALRAGAGAPAVLNAANEVAVAAFLAGRLGFLGIADVAAAALDELGAPPLASFADAAEIDERARTVAEVAIARHAPTGAVA